MTKLILMFSLMFAGSAHAANLFSSSAKLTWKSGEEFVKTFNLEGSRHSKSFCSLCSSAMPNLQMQGKLLVVPAGSLDTDLAIRPTAHLFNLSKAKWDTDLENIKKFEGFPN